MATIRTPIIRHVLHSTRSPLRLNQRRWAQVHDVRFLATHRDPNTVLEKYKDKLKQKAREEGHESISSLKEAYKYKITEFKQKATSFDSPPPSPTPLPSQAQPSSHSPFQQPPPPPPEQYRTAPSSAPKSETPGIKPLSSYLDLSKVSGLPNKEIEVLWRLRFARDPQSLCAVISLETYKRISQTALSHPQFILPLPRELPDSGEDQPSPDQSSQSVAADIHFLQWGFHPPSSTAPQLALPPGQVSANTHTSTVLFTHLANYKIHGTYAPAHTTLTHHLDLADSHGIVLLNGSVVKDKGVSVEEGKWLVMQLQRFYDFEGMGKGRRRELVEGFTKGEVKEQPGDGKGFNVEDLVEEAGKMA